MNDQTPKSSLPVKLSAVAEEMDVMDEELTAFISSKTGELLTLSQDDMDLAESDPNENDPEWQRELAELAQRVANSGEFLALPDKFEIHEWSIMESFAFSLEDKQACEKLARALSGKGAFRHFRDTLIDLGIRDKWYEYREEALEEIAAQWLDSNDIAYERTTPKTP